MLNEETPEEVYQLTPKGELMMEIVESINQMLVEQRQALLSKIFNSGNALYAKDTYQASLDLVEALCIIGLEKFGR